MTAPDQCCINVKKLLSIRRRPHMTQSGHKRSAFAAMHAPDVLYVVHDCWLSGKPMKRREFMWLLGGAALVPDSKGYTLRQKFFDVIHIAA